MPGVVVHYSIGDSSPIAADRRVGWGIKDFGWQRFVDDLVRPDVEWVRQGGAEPRVILHNPFGTIANQAMQFDQYIHARDGVEGVHPPLPWLINGFVDAIRSLVVTGVEVILYFGALKDTADPDFAQYDTTFEQDDWMCRVMECGNVVLDCGASPGFDAIGGTTNYRERAIPYIDFLSDFTKVYIEPRPRVELTRLHRHNIISVDPFFDRSDPEKHADSAWAARNWQLKGEIIRLCIHPPPGESYAVESQKRWRKADAVRILKLGHTPSFPVRDLRLAGMSYRELVMGIGVSLPTDVRDLNVQDAFAVGNQPIVYRQATNDFGLPMGIADNELLMLGADGELVSSNINSGAVATIDMLGTVAGLDAGTAAGEVPVLAVGGVLPTSVIPAIALTEFLGTVVNQAAMLALANGDRGDWVIRSDTGTVFVLVADDQSQLASWQELEYPAAPVQSVNGQSGVVVLSAADVGAYTTGQVDALIAAIDAASLGVYTTAESDAITDALDTRIGDLETATTPANLLAAILTVDGAASGLDADKVDGSHATELLGLHVGLRNGAYYPHALWAGFVANVTFAANFIHACPVYVPEDTTITKLGVYCSTAAAGSNIRLGLYTNSNGAPNALLVDSGAISTAAGGEKEATVAVAVSRGWYWLAYLSDNAAVGVRSTNANEIVGVPILGLLNPATQTTVRQVVVAHAFGALPDPFGAPTFQSASQNPGIWYRKGV